MNDEYLGSRSPVEREFQDDEDILSLQPGQVEARDLDLDTHSNLSEIQRAEDDTSDRFLKYKSDENVSEETRQILLDLFCDDACVRKADLSTGIVLDKTKSDILSQSWRISAPINSRLTEKHIKVLFLSMKRRKTFSKFLPWMILWNTS